MEHGCVAACLAWLLACLRGCVPACVPACLTACVPACVRACLLVCKAGTALLISKADGLECPILPPIRFRSGLEMSHPRL